MVAGLAVIEGEFRPRPLAGILGGGRRIGVYERRRLPQGHQPADQGPLRFTRRLRAVAGLRRLLLDRGRLLPDPLPVRAHSLAERLDLEGGQRWMPGGIHGMRDHFPGGHVTEMARQTVLRLAGWIAEVVHAERLLLRR